MFANDVDQIKYFSLLKEESSRYHLIILSYCLMSNHVHFMAVPQSEDSRGHLFQGRFFSCVLDERLLLNNKKSVIIE